MWSTAELGEAFGILCPLPQAAGEQRSLAAGIVGEASGAAEHNRHRRRVSPCFVRRRAEDV
jgi:hypothetical protein